MTSLGALWVAGCDGSIRVTFFTGAQELEIAAAAFALPAELEDDDGGIASVPCGPSGMCPPSDTIAITCEEGVCDPAPTTLSGRVGRVVDVQALLAETRELGLRQVDSYTVEELSYEVTRNTLELDLGAVELFWGPEAAPAIDEAWGVHLLGRAPPIAAGDAPSGEIELDPEGAAALGEYLTGTDSRVRFFARTVVDLDPGDRFPEGGRFTLGVNAAITAIGRVN